MCGNLVVYASQQVHSSIMRGAIAAGFGSNQVRLIETDDGFAMQTEALQIVIKTDLKNDVRPCCIVTAIGSTSSCGINPLPQIVEIAQSQGVWLHTDCAYGGALAIVPGYRSLFTGLDAVDSWVVNPHKWLFAPLDNCNRVNG